MTGGGARPFDRPFDKLRVSGGITRILTFPREGGREKRGWIPACAGMTVGVAGMTVGRSTLRQAQGERRGRAISQSPLRGGDGWVRWDGLPLSREQEGEGKRGITPILTFPREGGREKRG